MWKIALLFHVVLISVQASFVFSSLRKQFFDYVVAFPVFFSSRFFFLHATRNDNWALTTTLKRIENLRPLGFLFIKYYPFKPYLSLPFLIEDFMLKLTFFVLREKSSSSYLAPLGGIKYINNEKKIFFLTRCFHHRHHQLHQMLDIEYEMIDNN
jgi:hypothetical protein